MSEIFHCDDKEMLVAYLYGEIDDDGRREVDRHLRTCAACAQEAEALLAVRSDLQAWTPPDVALDFAVVSRTAMAASPRGRLGDLPAWAQLAAAVLVIGIGAAVANVQVRSDERGLVVTTGWMTPAAPEVAAAAAPASTAADWKPALVALEESLRHELAAMQPSGSAAAAPAAATAPSADAAALLRRVQLLIDASEERQRQEFALRLTQVRRELDMNRQADLMRIDRSFGALQGRTFKTAADQQELMNYVRRVSTQPVP